MAKEYDVLFRLLLLGDSGVGKTCMLRRFTEGEFDPLHISTIGNRIEAGGKKCYMLNTYNEMSVGRTSDRAAKGVDFKMKTIEIDGTKVRVQIWDTAGQERYQTITKQYYRRAQGIVFVYDITNEPSFQHIVKWASDVDEFAPDDVQTILVGNKADEEMRRQVTKDQGYRLAENYGMEFFETSASTSSNICESFIRVTELVLQAHRRDVDNLLGSLDDYLDNVVLEKEKRSQDNDVQRTCAC